jgi:hypothetical protein
MMRQRPSRAERAGCSTSLAEAEKGGRFRPLIPLSEVDTTRTGYKEYTAHPQWILGKGPQKGTGNDPAT